MDNFKPLKDPISWIVWRAVSKDVDNAAFDALEWAVYNAVNGAVRNAAYVAVWRAVSDVADDAGHPGFEDFLRAAGIYVR